MIPGELFHHIVVHQEWAAHHCHNEVRDGQVGDEQIGEVAELFVACQRGDEYEVSQTTDEHDADKHQTNDNGGHKEGLALRGVWDITRRDAIVHIIVVHVVIHLVCWKTPLHLSKSIHVADVGVPHVFAHPLILVQKDFCLTICSNKLAEQLCFVVHGASVSSKSDSLLSCLCGNGNLKRVNHLLKVSANPHLEKKILVSALVMQGSGWQQDTIKTNYNISRLWVWSCWHVWHFYGILWWKMFLGEVIMSGKGFYVIYEELVTLQQASVIGQGLAWWQGISYAARGGSHLSRIRGRSRTRILTDSW